MTTESKTASKAVKIPRLLTAWGVEYFVRSRRDVELVGDLWIGDWNGKRIPLRPEFVETWERDDG